LYNFSILANDWPNNLNTTTPVNNQNQSLTNQNKIQFNEKDFTINSDAFDCLLDVVADGKCHFSG